MTEYLPEVDEEVKVKALNELVGHMELDSFSVMLELLNEGPHRGMGVFLAIGESDGAFAVGASVQEIDAVLDLVGKLYIGQLCGDCLKPVAFEDSRYVGVLPAGELICWIQWDPELKRYRRGCE
jgi:hypothetical protein